MNGEKRTSLIVLAIAVLSIILAGVFEPRIGAQAKANDPTPYTIESVSDWLFRFAAWLPGEEPAGHPNCPSSAQPAPGWGIL